MFLALGRLDFQTAFQENPFMLLSLPLLLSAFAVQLWRYLKTGEKKRYPVCQWIEILFIAGAVVFGIMRNL